MNIKQTFKCVTVIRHLLRAEVFYGEYIEVGDSSLYILKTSEPNYKSVHNFKSISRFGSKVLQN